jgi:indolepyruvate decarboxylase
MSAPAPESWTVGAYLVERLRQVGVGHVFGVPGDYVLQFMDEIVASDVELVGTCNELNAGYAADAYARLNGVGAVCVTYAVGGFSVLNAIAGAFAERVPVVAISGGPSLADRKRRRLLHHTLGDYDVQVAVFEHVTERSILLDDAARAPEQIDSTLRACLSSSRPVFIEVPADMVAAPCSAPEPFEFSSRPASDPDVLQEAVEEAARLLSAAQRPLLLGGVEVHRFGLQDELEALIDHMGVPIATALMGKSVIRETHPQYVGVYSGALSEDYVRELVEGADCVLSLGAWMSDINLGVYTAKIDPQVLIHASADRVQIKHHYFDRVYLGDFIESLQGALPARESPVLVRPASRALAADFAPDFAKAITIERFYARMNHFLGDENVVLADAGDSFLCAGDLLIHDDVGFICQAFYCSIGFTVPAALGVGLADPTRRPVLFVGDGAFQMTAQELSTLIRHRLNPVIFLMNNRGYTVERVIHDGPYNDIANWQYSALPAVFGGGWSCQVRTEGELEPALVRALAEPDELAFIEVQIDPLDCSAALTRLGRELAKQRGFAPAS